MAKYLVETFYNCSFKVSHYLEEVSDQELQNLEKRDDGKYEILDVKLDKRKTKSLDQKSNTKKFEDSTKYSYPGSKYMPDRFNAIDAALLFGSPNADTSNLSVNPYNPDSIYTPAKSIADNAGDPLSRVNFACGGPNPLNTHLLAYTQSSTPRCVMLNL